MSTKTKVRLLKVGVWLAALAPLAWCVVGFFRDWLGANPIETLEHVTGFTTLTILLITLMITPIRRITGWNPVIRLRRPIGLFAFFYACLHFGTWAGLDQTLVWSWMMEDIAKRPYITVGFTGFLLLIPLALTSTKASIRRLGKKWTTIHRLIYVTAALGVIHYYWSVKADVRIPLLLGAIYVALMAFRLAFWARKRARSRTRPAPGPRGPRSEPEQVPDAA